MILMGKVRYGLRGRSRGDCVRLWVCEAQGCRASITTIHKEIERMRNEHNHGPVFSKSRFGNPVIEYSGFRYNLHKTSRLPKGLWVCSRVSSGCKAKLVTLLNQIVKAQTEHNHAPVKKRLQ
ncbi:hypothetical protein JYU34_004432 [Plutella xylostella]|uniref:FLYWCH-type domain-containing protein n=1 Tax=Plutella xylostella TaxID=51655 RepID=A0ABQ7QXZ5_PLUXY|nr:hypothetical protein JYU34_004432 [Plutella xylostella]